MNLESHHNCMYAMSKDAPRSGLFEYIHKIAKINYTGSEKGEILIEGLNTPKKCHMH